MKKFCCCLMAAVCFLSCVVLPVSAAALSPMAQMELLCGYNQVVREEFGKYSKYGYYDFEGDGCQELILLTGESAAEEQYHVYGWKNGAVTLLDSFDGGHSVLYAPPGENRLLLQYGHMGYEGIYEISLKNGAITEKKILERQLGAKEDYTQLQGMLEMYPTAAFVFPDADHLTDMQNLYVDQIFKTQALSGEEIGYADFYYFPDMTGGGYPDMLADYPIFEEVYLGDLGYDTLYAGYDKYVLYENKNGKFINGGSLDAIFSDFTEPNSGAGVMARNLDDNAYRLKLSGGKLTAERTYEDWWSVYANKKPLPSINAVSLHLDSRPDAPDGVRAQTLSDSSVRLTWNETGRTAHFEVYCADSKNGVYRLCKEVQGDFGCTVTGLQAGTTYYFRVKAVEDCTANLEDIRPYFDYSVSSAFSAAVSAKTSGGAAPQYQLGDVTGDGVIAAEDARLALRRAVGLEDYKEGSAPFLACDVTKDGVVSAEDARLILRAAVGLETLA